MAASTEDPPPEDSLDERGDTPQSPDSSLSLLIGACVGITYTALAGLAYLRYPAEFSPWHNDTLSKLGNAELNPDGAVVYNVGAALTGALTIAFFASLGVCMRSSSRVQRRLLRSVQSLGAVGGLALFMAAVYPEDQLQVHQFWSSTLFVCLGSAILLSPFALRRGSHPPRDLIAVASAAVLVDLASFVFADSHWIEWATVALFMVYMGAVGLHNRRLAEGDTVDS